MRKTAVVLVVLCAAQAVAQDATPYSVAARTPHYEFSIDVNPQAGGDTRYEMTITELETKTVVARPVATGGGGVVANAEGGGARFRIEIVQHDHALRVDFEVEKGGSVVDSLTAEWNMSKRRTRMDTTGALRVGGDVKAPVVIHRVEPVYPEEARRDRISGVVILEVVIDKTGTVRDAVVLKDLPGLGQSAIDAVKQWQFKPATMNGEPVDVIFNLTVNFKLAEPPKN